MRAVDWRHQPVKNEIASEQVRTKLTMRLPFVDPTMTNTVTLPDFSAFLSLRWRARGIVDRMMTEPPS